MTNPMLISTVQYLNKQSHPSLNCSTQIQPWKPEESFPQWSFAKIAYCLWARYSNTIPVSWKYAHPVNMGIPGFPFSRYFRDPVVIIRTLSACQRYGDRDDAYHAGGYSHANVETYQTLNGQVWSGKFTSRDPTPREMESSYEKLKMEEPRCQVNIGIPKNTHPRYPYSREYRHPDAYIYVNTGTWVPIFTVNMGIPLWK